MEKYQLIERSIIKKYKDTIWHRFIGGLKDYQMISEGDKIAVCISGGKDSMLLAKCMQHLQKYSDYHFEAEYIVMDPGYNEKNLQQIISNSKLLNIPIKIFNANIFDYVKWGDGSPCYLCARMRRGNLYKFAKSLGCNKISLGHHFDDVIETILMSMMYGAEVKTMMPKLHSTNFEGMELIRPLYMVKEKDIISWAQYNDLRFIQCACRFTEDIEEKGEQHSSKRQEMKELIAQLREKSSYIDMNIFRSVHNINLTTIIGYREGEKKPTVSFLDNYNK